MKTKMKVAQITKPGGDFELVERDIPEPGTGQVRVKVEACGICHSDVLVKDGLWPGLQYPRVPGHEVAGRVDAIGAGVATWKKGDRVGVGWHGVRCLGLSIPRNLLSTSRLLRARISVGFLCRRSFGESVEWRLGLQLLLGQS